MSGETSQAWQLASFTSAGGGTVYSAFDLGRRTVVSFWISTATAGATITVEASITPQNVSPKVASQWQDVTALFTRGSTGVSGATSFVLAAGNTMFIQCNGINAEQLRVKSVCTAGCVELIYVRCI